MECFGTGVTPFASTLRRTADRGENMDEGKNTRPHWWSRPRQADGDPAPAAPPPPDAPPAGPGAPVPPGPADPVPAAPPVGPLAGEPPVPPPHPADPYDTPPYGPPGPWAPAPPVQRTWQPYDPWAAPGYPAVVPVPATATGRRRGRLLAGAVLIALVAGGIGGVTGAWLQRAGGVGGVTLPQAPADHSGRAAGTVAAIARAALPGVVYIHVKGGGEEATGTGFLLDSDGRIITNNHVVEPAATSGEISVTFNGGTVRKARVLGRDGGYDLAVIKVDGVAGLRPLPLGNSDSVRVGDPVVAIGAPFGLEGTVTSGIISAKDRPITAGGSGGGGDQVSYVDALQTDAPINPGNSGGPLMNGQGQVIGINSAIRSADGGASGGIGGQGGSIGLGFAIPVNQARRVAEELINTGHAEHPVIGVTVDMRYTGDGARIADKGTGGAPAVVPGGPGDAAGLASGDVITAVDGDRVHSGQELIVKTRSHRPGDRITLTVRPSGGGAEHTVELVLGSSSGG
ncbi:putative protease [Streptantibioticus cattleyicolor NRRL 8057 = DSM 46488]|nr:putative protease [Streptantibioticus cattleyicolor NRRL 8057 = DSM 46488]